MNIKLNNELLEIIISEGIVVGKEPECIKDLFEGACYEFMYRYGIDKYNREMYAEVYHKCMDYIYFDELPVLNLSKSKKYEGIFSNYNC